MVDITSIRDVGSVGMAIGGDSDGTAGGADSVKSTL